MRAEPIAIQDAPRHPAFSYRPETGEDPFHAFLGVPIAASIAVVLRYIGDLIDLRTGERRAEDIVWATDDGQSIAHEGEKHAAFFRALVSRRIASREGNEGTDKAVVELPGGQEIAAEGTGWLGKLMRWRPVAPDSEATPDDPTPGAATAEPKED